MTDAHIGAAHVSSRVAVDGRPDESAAGAHRIGEAARRLGVSPSVLRLWERQGLVRPARSAAGYRLYSDADLDVLGRVHRMRSEEGVNAPGIRHILASVVARSAGDEPARGEGLRRLRLAAGLSQRAAAQRACLSAGYLSALERDAAGASVATLQRLTAAYGATLQGLFPARPGGRLVRPEQRAVLEVGAGVRIEQLAGGGDQLEPHLFVLDPGASSDGAYSHPGEEFIYVLDGSVRITLGEDEYYDLATDDALTFASTLAHAFENPADTPARLLWINTPPTF